MDYSIEATNLNDLIARAMHGKRVEPEQRLVGGQFGYAIHRFPIKGGITLRDVMAESIREHNALLRRFMERG